MISLALTTAAFMSLIKGAIHVPLDASQKELMDMPGKEREVNKKKKGK